MVEEDFKQNVYQNDEAVTPSPIPESGDQLQAQTNEVAVTRKGGFSRARRLMLKDAMILASGAWALGERIWHTEHHQPVQAVAPESVLTSLSEITADAETSARAACLSFILPIPGLALATLPASRMPNALRAYRRGLHCGFDLYCAFGTEVRALDGGVVTRADSGFVEMDPALHRYLLATCAALNTTPVDAFERLLGRTVEVDHGLKQGVRFRSVYAHLSAVAVSEGNSVKQGVVIGSVGNSGTSAGVRGSRDEAHLHLELRLQRAGSRETYLGEGLKEEKLRQLLGEMFRNG